MFSVSASCVKKDNCTFEITIASTRIESAVQREIRTYSSPKTEPLNESVLRCLSQDPDARVGPDVMVM